MEESKTVTRVEVVEGEARKYSVPVIRDKNAVARREGERRRAMLQRAWLREFSRKFPRKSGMGEQVAWFQEQFLDMAALARNGAERGAWMKLAYDATVRANSNAVGENLEAYKNHLERMLKAAKG